MVRVSTGFILLGNNRLIAGDFYWMKDNNKIRGIMNLQSTFIRKATSGVISLRRQLFLLTKPVG